MKTFKFQVVLFSAYEYEYQKQMIKDSFRNPATSEIKLLRK